MKKCQLFILLLFFIKSSFAQTSNFDELPLPILRQKLALSKSDTTTVKLQLALGHLMLLKASTSANDIDSAKRFSTQASALSRRLGFQFGIINAMLLNTEILYSQKAPDNALMIAQNALAFSIKHRNSDGEARSYYLISRYYSTSNSLEKKLYYVNKAVTIFRKNRNSLWLSFMLTNNADLLFQGGRNSEGLKLLFEALNLGKAVSRRTVEGIYWNIGRVSMRTGDYANALKYNLLAIKTAKEVNDTTMQVAWIKHLVASTFIRLGDYKRAIPYSVEVMKMAKRFNAPFFTILESSSLAFEYIHLNRLAEALTVLNEIKSNAKSDDDRLSVNVDFLYSLIYAKKLSEAGVYVQEVKKILPLISKDNIAGILNAYNGLAYYYSETNQFNEVYRYSNLYTALAHQLSYIEDIDMAENRYYKLAIVNRDPNSVIGHFLKGQQFRDSVYNRVKAYQAFLLEMENETLAKNRHIDSLTLDAQIKEIKLKRNQLIQKVTIFGSVMLLIITGLIYSQYRLKQRSNTLLTQQKEEIDQKNSALQQLILDKNELLKDKDELLSEKELLFKEVNHRVKNNLQSVMLLLENQAATLEGDAFDAVNISRHRIYAMSLVHEKLIESSKLKSVNMGIYLPQLIEHIRESFQGAAQINFKTSVEELIIDVSLALPLALIVNEAVTNAFKYAFPNQKHGEIFIAFGKIKEQIRLEIADNGVGIDNPLKTKANGGTGFKLIRGLCEDIDAKITIKNASGTRIIIQCNNDQQQEEVNLELVLAHLPDLNTK
ncbi:Two-component sensor histidine kinase, contains HisKA and HATPase domains [Mucilaginibacter gossypiicola]|uniref:histidine kinase n=1 Tax=Mucilaginibacter gossypiicola TaxID=551995 RepID=A0A1H8BJV2_9SPHI|nr:histidine kinase dimerization/phosphoacceptor domain -containing protein [Mucilaginibacter gossypiicola]SEM82338.1 Two-component sensor histidine kinase, contains HisKA and HATPase domains [Mucilaginibacter gossypiicola]